MAKPLLKEYGIASILLENPFCEFISVMKEIFEIIYLFKKI
jgi:hypothetical protein